MTSFDVITLGETMIRFTPFDYKIIEQSEVYQVHVGGTESNTAVGLTRLGLKVAHIIRLTDNSLGHHIINTLRGFGVDMSYTVKTDQDRIGTYFLEEGLPPRSSRVIYDRANSAMSRMQADDLPDIFQADFARMLHTTGITMGIGESALATVSAAVSRAKQAGWIVSFDLNYRANLWSYATAAKQCHDVMSQADILFFPIRDAVQLFALDDSSSPQEVAAHLAGLFPQAHIVLTLGSDGALCRSTQGEILMQDTFLTEAVIGRVGGGDAFTAGFLYGYLAGDDLSRALLWGVATAAMKYTISGDIPLVDKKAVIALMQGASSAGIKR